MERPLRILRLTAEHYLPPELGRWDLKYDPVGGMALASLLLSQQAARWGWRESVLTLGLPGGPKSWQVAKGSYAHAVSIPIPRIANSRSGSYGLIESWAAGAAMQLRRRRLLSRYDLVHLHLDGTVAALWLGGYLQRYANIPVSATVHCYRDDNYETPWLGSSMRMALASFQNRVLAGMTGIIALTPSRAAELTNLRRGQIVRTVPEAIEDLNVHRFEPAHRDWARKRLGLTFGEVVVGFVGRLSWEKGWSDYLDVVASLSRKNSRVTGVVIGGGLQQSCERARYVRQTDRGIGHVFDSEDSQTGGPSLEPSSTRMSESGKLRLITLDAYSLQNCGDHSHLAKREFSQITCAVTQSAAEAVARSLGIADRIRITGYMDHQSLLRLLPALDVALFPSGHEEHGTAVTEAMACGVPVCAYRVGGMAEVVRNRGYLVDPGDVSGLASACMQAFEDVQASPERFRTVQQEVSTIHSIEAGGKAFRNFLDDCLVHFAGNHD